MKAVFETLWIILCILVGYNLVLPVIFFIIYKLKQKKTQPVNQTYEPDFAIIVTAYQHINTLPQAVASLLKLNYSNYLIYVVADNCDITGLHFDDDRVILLRPEQELRSNTRSHFYAINRFRRNHEYLTIIDSDNLTDPEYLNALNQQFFRGFEAVQGVRKAKNFDSVYACIDAVQDIYYHFYDREILFALGSSATLAGSGMAFKTELYRKSLEDLDITGAGFDKVLQLAIVKQRRRIAFAKNAIVYDEKTSRADQLVKQRARWFNTWFRYAGLGVQVFVNSIYRLNWNAFLFALMFLRPPLFMIVVGCFILMITSLFINPVLALCWLVAFALFFTALMISLVHSKADRKIYESLKGIPLFMFYQLLSLTKVRKANKISVATQHYHTQSIEELKGDKAEHV